MFAPAVLRPFLVIASLLALLLLSGPPLGVKADGQPSPDDGTAAGPACGAVSGDEEAVAATRAAADEACDCSSAASHDDYVSCVSAVTEQAVQEGKLREDLLLLDNHPVGSGVPGPEGNTSAGRAKAGAKWA